MTHTKLNLPQTTPLLLPPEVGSHVAQVESSLVEVAIVEVVLCLKTLLYTVEPPNNESIGTANFF